MSNSSEAGNGNVSIRPEIAERTYSSALEFLVTAGRINARLAGLSLEERTVARSGRRQLAESGCNLLSLVFGGPAVVEVQEKDEAKFTDPLTYAPLVCDSDFSSSVCSDADAPDFQKICEWLGRSLSILRLVAPGMDNRSRSLTFGMIRSVVRPLCEAAAIAFDRSTQSQFRSITDHVSLETVDADHIEGFLSELATSVATDSESSVPSLMEAAAGLLRLADGAQSVSNDVSVLEVEHKTTRTPEIVLSFDGPYLVSGDLEIANYLGEPLHAPKIVALCRCGKSSVKPFCDGSHIDRGFAGEKDSHRILDYQDAYQGQQLTVLDNRGICAHSGFCTDRLNSVFHVGEEPFVTPSGGRLDDIMRAVRRCPSGALSLRLSEVEDRDYVDKSRPPSIEISKDGPYRITGSIPILDERRRPVQRNQGSSREHYSLCRCGSSLNKPFCSGMHWPVKFSDPQHGTDWEPTLFEWAGGYPALLEMTQLFYSRYVPIDPVVGPLFARMEADHPERVAAWLSEVFGGPAFYSERYGGYNRMISQHLDKHLTQEQRSHWARLMAQSADEAGLPGDAEFRAAFTAYIEWGSRIAVENSSSDAKPSSAMPMPRWWWVCNASPGTRISALSSDVEAADDSAPVALATGETPGFEKHVKQLFRPMDRSSMKFVFDLWSYEDVRKHASSIYSRVQAGTMPCDKAWETEKVDLFKRWLNGGMMP